MSMTGKRSPLAGILRETDRRAQVSASAIVTQVTPTGGRADTGFIATSGRWKPVGRLDISGLTTEMYLSS